MTNDELTAVLRLQNVPNIGDITAKKLIAHCGGPEAVFSEKLLHLEKIEGIGTLMLRGLQDRQHLEAAQREMAYLRKHAIEWSYFMDADYPAYLKHCIDGPILLFKRGQVDFETNRTISIVGTRNVTSYGLNFCEELVAQLAPLNPTIVSGYAYGVDICAHKAAIKNGLQTIGCLAHGLNQTYPPSHARFNQDMEKKGGFVTEFWSTSKPDRENFLRRNRIIAGLSVATVVIESAEKGGSLVTADIACSYNRDVFAVPGRSSDSFSVGCNNLIKQQKAHMLTSPADLVYMLGWDLELPKSKPVQKQLFVELDPYEESIYGFLQKTGKQQLDSISLKCELPVYRVSSTLLNMEMKGVIRPLPGKLYEAI